jgi:C-terminal processing protease CtpA/Prc
MFAIVLLAGASLTAFAEGERGSFGFAVQLDTEGFFIDPTVRTVTVEQVLPDSPAALSGIVAGDQIVVADGITVAGRRARELEPVVRKSVGESLHLRLRRANGAYYEVDLVAVPKRRDS